MTEEEGSNEHLALLQPQQRGSLFISFLGQGCVRVWALWWAAEITYSTAFPKQDREYNRGNQSPASNFTDMTQLESRMLLH